MLAIVIVDVVKSKADAVELESAVPKAEETTGAVEKTNDTEEAEEVEDAGWLGNVVERIWRGRGSRSSCSAGNVVERIWSGRGFRSSCNCGINDGSPKPQKMPIKVINVEIVTASQRRGTGPASTSIEDMAS